MANEDYDCYSTAYKVIKGSLIYLLPQLLAALNSYNPVYAAGLSAILHVVYDVLKNYVEVDLP